MPSRFRSKLTHLVQAIEDRQTEEHGIRFDAFKANLLDAFVVELAERQSILMPPGTNNDSADRTQRMATASAIVNKITGQNWANETKLSLPIVRT